MISSFPKSPSIDLTVAVGFVDFWPGFDPYRNVFINSLSVYANIIVHDNPDPETPPDILFYSCFEQFNKVFICPKVQFLGECIAPNPDSYSLSFFPTSGTNAYLPLWLTLFDWHNSRSKDLFPVSIFNQLSQDHNLTDNEFETFELRLPRCAVIMNNPIKERLALVERIQSIIPCDLFGRAFHNPFDPSDQAKLSLLSRYKFHYCDENTIFPGYITEKLIHACIAGCIPIYSHSSLKGSCLNPGRTINSALDSTTIAAMVSDPHFRRELLSSKLIVGGLDGNYLVKSIAVASFGSLRGF